MMPVVGNLVGRVDIRCLIAFRLIATSLALFNMTRFDTDVDYATVVWCAPTSRWASPPCSFPQRPAPFSACPYQSTTAGWAIFNMMCNLGGSLRICVAMTVLARWQASPC
jgi:DHA2 family multidrug resistance protein